METHILLLSNCRPVAYCWHMGAPIHFSKSTTTSERAKVHKVSTDGIILDSNRKIHAKSTWTFRYSSYNQLTISCGITKEEKNKPKIKKKRVVLLFKPFFFLSAEALQSCWRANLSYCAEETHQSYWEKTVLKMGHKIWQQKKIQPLSLIFAISTGFLFRFVPNTVQQSKF